MERFSPVSWSASCHGEYLSFRLIDANDFAQAGDFENVLVVLC